MPDQTTTLLARHDAAARRLLDQIEGLAHCVGDRCTAQQRRALRSARARLLDELADYQLVADAAGVDGQPRAWMRRALRDAADDALPLLVRRIRRALDESTSWAA